MRILLCCILSLGTLSGYAQSSTPMTVPTEAISQLEDVKELTKLEAVTKQSKGKMQAETRPDINRFLVMSADDFLRIALNSPTKEAYLQCMDKGLARLAPLTTDAEDRQQVADFFQELMEIVGMPSSEGRLTAFTASKAAKQ